MEVEIWKDIVDYENLYQVSSIGRIKSLRRKEKIKNGYRTIRERILKPAKDKKGYLRVVLCKEGIQKTMKVHRLVCEAFLPNPLNLPQINHKDECKTNNRVDNLEFCDNMYNSNYGTKNERSSKAHTGVYNTKKSKKVKCIDTGKIYPSASEVQRQLGFAKSNICNCCRGKYKQAYGYHWSYVE